MRRGEGASSGVSSSGQEGFQSIANTARQEMHTDGYGQVRRENSEVGLRIPFLKLPVQLLTSAFRPHPCRKGLGTELSAAAPMRREERDCYFAIGLGNEKEKDHGKSWDGIHVTSRALRPFASFFERVLVSCHIHVHVFLVLGGTIPG